MRLMRERLPEGSAHTSSPTRTTPETTFPQKPRKSKLGRETYCTGKRKSFKLWSLPIWTFSKNSSKLGPSYHGVRSLFSTTLSPSKAESGMQVTSSKPKGVVKARKSATISLKTFSSKATKSILLTAKTRWRIPKREVRNVWRRVCVITPLRASTKMIARLAVEPPVIILRVYCS